jgi:serine/threonine protein kinase
MAPEIIAGEHYSDKADIFALGVLLYGILTGQQPRQGVEDSSEGVDQLYEKGRPLYIAGSPLYIAPERIAGPHYSKKVDVFSFGVLLYEIVTGKNPCQGVEDSSDGVYQLYEKVLSGNREEIPRTVEPFTASLISRCWNGNPDDRPTFLEIFDELRENRFRLFRTVDPEAVEQFLQSLM